MKNTLNYKLSELKTIKEASISINFPLRSIYNLLKQGKIQPIVFGRRMLLDTKTIEQLRTLRAANR